MRNLADRDHPVVKEILRRHDASGTDPESNRSKLGLVVEGGGLRGVISGGALVAMERLGFTDVFDQVYGESAGAINACYFLARQADFGSRIYLEDLPSFKFINPLRIGRMLDLDYAIDEVVAHIKPLDVERVLRSGSELFIAVTDASDASTRLIDIKNEHLPLLTVLKATGAITPLYGKAVLLDGKTYVDGGISNPIPVVSAIRGGCTHILVLLTQPPEFIYEALRGVERFCARALLSGWDPRFIERFFTQRIQRYNRARQIAFGESLRPQDPQIAVIAPSKNDPHVSRMTLSSKRLRDALESSIRKTSSVFVT